VNDILTINLDEMIARTQQPTNGKQLNPLPSIFACMTVKATWCGKQRAKAASQSLTLPTSPTASITSMYTMA